MGAYHLPYYNFPERGKGENHSFIYFVTTTYIDQTSIFHKNRHHYALVIVLLAASRMMYVT